MNQVHFSSHIVTKVSVKEYQLFAVGVTHLNLSNRLTSEFVAEVKHLISVAVILNNGNLIVKQPLMVYQLREIQYPSFVLRSHDVLGQPFQAIPCLNLVIFRVVKI